MEFARQSGISWVGGALRRKVFKLMFAPALEGKGHMFISGADHIGQEFVVLGGCYEPENVEALRHLFSKYGLGGELRSTLARTLERTRTYWWNSSKTS